MINKKIAAMSVLSSTLVFVCCGCAKADSAADVYTLSENSKEKYPSKNFQDHYQGASNFFDMRKRAQDLFDQGRYEESLLIMEDAHKNYVTNRSTETMSLLQMAKTYEALGKNELAANFYEGAAKSTMNENRALEFSQKAQLLRQKVKTT